MIFGDIVNWNIDKDIYCPAIKKAVEYLMITDFCKLENGRYDIDGDRLYALVSEPETMLKADRKPESHIRYADLHYMISGEEIIGFSVNSQNNEVVEDLTIEKDTLLYRNMENEMEVVLTPGKFAFFLPSDIHRPCCTRSKAQKIRKVVVKIDVSVF